MTERKSHLDSFAIVSLVVCCFLWGINQVASKVALAEMPPLLQAAVRSLGGVVLVLLWARLRGIPMFERDNTLRGGLLAGALFAAEFAAIFVGLSFTAASRMIVFVNTAPFFVAIGMPFISKSERLSRGQAVGLLTAFGGVALAFAEGFTRPAIGPLQWLGDGLGLLGGALWAATTLSIRGTRLTSASAEKTLAYQLGVSGVLLLIGALVAGETWPATLSPLTLGSLAYQIIVVVSASYLLWFWLMRHYPATRMAAFTLLTPVFGLLAGAWWLNEPITARLLLALAGVTVGMLLVNRR